MFFGVFVSSMDCSSGLWVALLGLCVYLPVGALAVCVGFVGWYNMVSPA